MVETTGKYFIPMCTNLENCRVGIAIVDSPLELIMSYITIIPTKGAFQIFQYEYTFVERSQTFEIKPVSITISLHPNIFAPGLITRMWV